MSPLRFRKRCSGTSRKALGQRLRVTMHSANDSGMHQPYGQSRQTKCPRRRVHHELAQRVLPGQRALTARRGGIGKTCAGLGRQDRCDRWWPQQARLCASSVRLMLWLPWTRLTRAPPLSLRDEALVEARGNQTSFGTRTLWGRCRADAVWSSKVSTL